MERGDVSLSCAWSLVDELVRGGVRRACLSPGSRSTPLALALARHPDVDLEVHLDERSSAFVALGIARATGRPVAVACTSGTAAAEFLPAVVEASMARVPLVLLTADRPPRLRGTGANQTIDQRDLYGRYAEFLEPPVPTGSDDAARWREVGRDALLGLGRTWQPVQINCPFDEPLTPSDPTASEEAPAGAQAPDGAPTPDDPPAVASEPLGPADAERLAAEVGGARGVVVIGPSWPEEVDQVDLGVFARLGWPVLAEPSSNLRRPGTLAAGQALVADEAWSGVHRPDVVLQLGATPTTRATQAFVRRADRLVVADRLHPDPDPDHRATWRLRADLRAVLAALASSDGLPGAPDGWLAAWRDADARARSGLDRMLDGWETPSEPGVARDVAASVTAGGWLLVGNSGPIRDLDLVMAPRDHLRIVANRGASGIDGLVSTAVGVAGSTGAPVTALLGDLSTIHDLGALAWNARRSDLDLTLVVIDNGGGQVFSALPQRMLPEHRRLFVTPHGLRIDAVCASLGVAHSRVERARDLAPALAARSSSPVRVVQVVTPGPDEERRTELRAVVSAALG